MSDDVAGGAPVTAMVFTLNEEVNLLHCLPSLQWCSEVIVVDSFSTDSTASICAAHGARLVQHAFEGFGTQRNWALDHAQARNKWILILDADERVPPELAAELTAIAQANPAGVGAWRVRRRFHMWGRWLKHSSLYPTWVVRFVHADRVRYENRGHAETQAVSGRIGDLGHDLIDENHKGIGEWYERQHRYAAKDAEFELTARSRKWQPGDLVSPDPLVRRAALKRVASAMPARGLAYFLYAYVWRLGFLDGREGFRYCRMRAWYQTQVASRVKDLKQRAVGDTR
ncbi:MAG TPA: glycosyltransferase family 2 protein [Ramlibacter sp.]|nr:glycosyltransferase family 2 protein [Ramlibacter sp.]